MPPPVAAEQVYQPPNLIREDYRPLNMIRLVALEIMESLPELYPDRHNSFNGSDLLILRDLGIS
jgi:hypothetical protein